MRNYTETQEDTLVAEEVKTDKGKVIIVYDDNVNTFDNVIECLMKYCSHSEEQATQCAWIVHNNGKCDVKRGTLDKLRPIYEALLENKLTVKLEELN